MPDKPFSSPELFHCPTCGASLPAPDAASVRCAYCGITVLVSPEFRPQKPQEQPVSPQPIVINLSEQPGETTPASRRPIGLVIGILVAVCVVLGIIGSVMASAGIFASTALVNSSIERIATQAIIVPTLPAGTVCGAVPWILA